VTLVYARFNNWHGDWAWGPRYLIFAIPALLVPAAFWVDHIWQQRRRVAQAIAVALVGLSFYVQVLGNAFYWDTFIRVGQEASMRWLGVPNRTGAHEPGAGGCGPCFEDMHPLNWLPPFQPIVGHHWMLGHVLRKHPWTAAEKDAPWRRTTSLTLPLAGSYPRARIDWWFLDFTSKGLGAGILLLVVFGGGAAGSGFLWARSSRAGRLHSVERLAA
jgi:hypothetical protein